MQERDDGLTWGELIGPPLCVALLLVALFAAIFSLGGPTRAHVPVPQGFAASSMFAAVAGEEHGTSMGPCCEPEPDDARPAPEPDPLPAPEPEPESVIGGA